MTRSIWLGLGCAVILAVTVGLWEPSKAQTIGLNPPLPEAGDLEMASEIRRLTDRSTDGLHQKGLADGGFELDLEGRFQSLPLAAIDKEGDVTVRCIHGLDE